VSWIYDAVRPTISDGEQQRAASVSSSAIGHADVPRTSPSRNHSSIDGAGGLVVGRHVLVAAGIAPVASVMFGLVVGAYAYAIGAALTAFPGRDPLTDPRSTDD
jgi:hypothetical protein